MNQIQPVDIFVLLTDIQGVGALIPGRGHPSGEPEDFRRFLGNLQSAIARYNLNSPDAGMPAIHHWGGDAFWWWTDDEPQISMSVLVEAHMLFASELLAVSADGPFPLFGPAVLMHGSAFLTLSPMYLSLPSAIVDQLGQFVPELHYYYAPCFKDAWRIIEGKFGHSPSPARLLVGRSRSDLDTEVRLRTALSDVVPNQPVRLVYWKEGVVVHNYIDLVISYGLTRGHLTDHQLHSLTLRARRTLAKRTTQGRLRTRISKLADAFANASDER